MSSAQAARLLGLSQATVVRRWQNHRLVAWRQGRAVRFPVWQFAGRKLLEGMGEVLQLFDSYDQWRVMRYFLGTRLSLGSRRPLDLLREGRIAEVIAHARAHAAENTW